VNWPTVPLRRIARFAYGDSLSSESREDGDVLVYGSNGSVGSHSRANTEGPVLVIGRKGSYGKVHYQADPVFAIDTTFFVDQRMSGSNLRWLFYALQTQDLDALSEDVGVPGLSRERAYEQPLPFPSLTTQRIIADYLDHETDRIDVLIAAKRRMVMLLREGLDARLTRLLDPTLQSSEYAELPVRRLLSKKSRHVSSLGVVTAFRDGMVTLRSRRREEGFTESDAQAGYQGVQKGDLVFHGLDGFAGAIGISEDDGICTPVYHVCSALPGVDAAYVAFALRALALSGYLNLQSGNVRERAVDFRNWDALARIRVPIPSLEQQSALAHAYIERRRWTSELVRMIDRQLALLDEHRQALVTAAVTGQLDISEAM
jgi:type I restriction enzyme, S subunit